MSMDARMVEHYEETLKGLSEAEQAIETEKLNQYERSKESYVGIVALTTMQKRFADLEKIIGKKAPKSCKIVLDEYVNFGTNKPYEGFCEKVPSKM